ncbi:LADA_0G06040g1_1 [Lachancea dasiensis]|uniref:LADA_0G06040g1_1 n=1 Tax=Lachancea dasiensis TaxID=1072105 RepID=A0A1G4JTB7_9SACH|nr:LADA_0G06040g1_1 [Lachancea dasiensis]
MVNRAAIAAQDIVSDYFLVFNNELHRFLDPLWTKSQLSSSHVHTTSRAKWIDFTESARRFQESSDSEVSLDEDDDGEDDDEVEMGEGCYAGAFWTSEEKEVFFYHLSRSSIHRVDEWAFFLPHKSKFEILTYFKVLRANLHELKSLDSKRHGGILPKAAFPIAYEMDEFFVELEEKLSAEADQILRHCEEEMAEASAASSKNDEDELIDIEKWRKRWSPMYSKTHISELRPASKVALEFSKGSLDEAVACVKSYLRRLLWFTVLPNLETKHIPKRDLTSDETLTQATQCESDDEFVVECNSKSIFPHVVTKDDVLRGLASMRQEQLMAPTLAETVLWTLKKFKLKTEEGRLFKTSQVAMGVVPRILAHAEASHNLELIVGSSGHGHVQNMPVDREADEFRHIHQKLYVLNGKKRSRDAFMEDDELDTIDNPLEELLCDLETRQLEELDVHASRLYQHTLLMFLEGEPVTTSEGYYLSSPQVPMDISTIPESVQREFQYE